MRTICTLLIVLSSVLCTVSDSLAQAPVENQKTLTFRFVPGNDVFYVPWEGNGEQLVRLYALIDEYRAEVLSGELPVYVEGYCASLPIAKDNLNTAYARSNRVKSELIIHKGLLEQHFITKNYDTAYTGTDGAVYRDIVVVTLRLPVILEVEAEPTPEPIVEQHVDKPLVVQPAPEPAPECHQDSRLKPLVEEEVISPKLYRFAVRTNLISDAFLLPTLGVEWRVNRDMGVKLDGSRSWWGNPRGKVQKIWLVSPEVRWYLLDAKRFYVGASSIFGRYNIYKYPVGGVFSSDTGYQGKLWNAGVTVGYQLHLSRGLALDFNLGMGYTRSKYDNFTVEEGVRIYKDKDKTKNFFGPTQAGVNLVWTIGTNR